MIKLSIIIPVYNEIKTIEKLINKILKLNIKKQVIVVDDGSSDGTQLILKKFKNKIDKLIVHNKNRGKGAAIKSAQKFVKGKYVGIQDADLEYNPKDLEKIVSEMAASAPIDADRVATIKEAISSGKYPLDMDKLSDALMQAYREMKS